jgi:rhodanese-related sulfurtransferase
MSKKLLGAVLAAAALTTPALALACEGKAKSAAAAKASVKNLTVAEVASLQKDKKATVLDANGEDFRKQNGVIPGAVLLTNYRTYDAAKELPAQKDQKLVFYCANTQCKASHKAAEKALEAGFTDVNVLGDGLMGWKAAGQSTASATPQS